MARLKITERIWLWIDERFDVADVMFPFLKKPVPRHAASPIYCLGGMAVLTFLIQAITGIFLGLYYVPTPDQAHDSIIYIMTVVPFGSIMRSLHHWSANLMIASVVLHLLRVFFTASYKNPRELNWMLGVLLLAFTVFFGFTGYILPWNQVSFWGSTIALQITATMPIIGPILAKILMGGDSIGGPTLLRLYILHVMVLPLVLTLSMLLHFVIIRLQGISGPVYKPFDENSDQKIKGL